MYLMADGEEILLQRYLHCHVCYREDIADQPLLRRIWSLASQSGQQCKIWCFTAVRRMKNAVFWDVPQYGSCKNRYFGRIYRLHLQGERLWVPLVCSVGVPHDERRHIPEDSIYRVPFLFLSTF
jgi:hypothetical protein